MSEARKRVTYTGPSPSVEISLPDTGEGLTCEQGVPVVVPGSVAKSLLAQDCWAEAGRSDDGPKFSSPSAKAAAGDLNDEQLVELAGKATGSGGKVTKADVETFIAATGGDEKDQGSGDGELPDEEESE